MHFIMHSQFLADVTTLCISLTVAVDRHVGLLSIEIFMLLTA